MTFVTRIAGAAAISAAILFGCGLLASPAQSGYIVTLTQQGTSVVATGSGSIDVTDLSADGTGLVSAEIDLAFPTESIITGPASSTAAAFYTGYRSRSSSSRNLRPCDGADSGL
jgi:hypothetical protein